jgi:hypothetical protein
MGTRKPSGDASLASLERLFEERFDNLLERFDEKKDADDARFRELGGSLDAIERDLKSGYATKDEVRALAGLMDTKVSEESIWWIKMVVGGMAGLILLSVGAAIIKVVIIGG